MDPTLFINPASNLVGQGVNAWLTNQQNRKNRNFADAQAKMAWSRDVQMWNMQNHYNSPSSQMNRLRDAGLNPHLMYGKGTTGNTTTLPKYNAPSWKGIAPQINLTDELGKYMDIKLRKEQVLTERARQYYILEGYTERMFENTLAQEKREYIDRSHPGYSADMAKEELRQKQLKNDIALEKKGISKSQAQWMRKKVERFNESQINIDKSHQWERILDKYIIKLIDSVPSLKSLKNASI